MKEMEAFALKLVARNKTRKNILQFQQKIFQHINVIFSSGRP